MTLPTFPASPPAPQRGVDSDEEFRPKADAFASWWAELPEALQEWIVGVVQAIGAANYSATSISSVAIGTGAKSFNVDSGKMFVAGQFLIVADSAAPTTNFMFGQVSGYHSVSGVLDLNVIYVQGSGTKSAWTIGLSAAAANLTTALNLVHTGTPSEDVYTIVDGPSVDIDPANGSIQFWTLGASRTPTAANLQNGQSIVLQIADGTAYAVTWSTIGVVWAGGLTPPLPASGYAVIVLAKAGGVVRGFSAQDTAS